MTDERKNDLVKLNESFQSEISKILSNIYKYIYK